MDMSFHNFLLNLNSRSSYIKHFSLHSIKRALTYNDQTGRPQTPAKIMDFIVDTFFLWHFGPFAAPLLSSA